MEAVFIVFGKKALKVQKTGMTFRGQKYLNDFKISASISFTKKAL